MAEAPPAMFPVSNLPDEVAVWVVLSLFFTVTVAPAFTVRFAGLNEEAEMVMSAVEPPVLPPVLPPVFPPVVPPVGPELDLLHDKRTPASRKHRIVFEMFLVIIKPFSK